MKKIFLASLLIASTLFASCDMDKSEPDTLNEETAIVSVNNCFQLRNNAYICLRGAASGSFIALPEIQMDQFIGIISNGNRIGTISNGNITSNDSDIAGIFASLYSRIANNNYGIAKIQEFLDKNAETLSQEDVNKLKMYIGEIKFARAYSYYYLVDHYCDSYTNVGGSGMGMPLVTEYNPTGDTSAYPGRSTQDKTYALIESDLNDALAALKEAESNGTAATPAPNAFYLSSYAVLAMQARVALNKGDYPTAFSKASEVIESGVYTLATPAEYPVLWTADSGKEIILRSFMSSTELGSSIGGSWNNINTIADYIPTADPIYLYEDNDIRFNAIFDTATLPIEGANYMAFIFNKFPGNVDLRTSSTNNYMNMPKVFRLSELYCIAAEAGAQCDQDAKASDYLNDLREQRISNYRRGTFSGTVLLNAARDEREKELLGEGFRMSDLRRWKRGFTRNGSYDNVNPDVTPVIVAAGKGVTYQAGDYRYVWPFPSEELINNPQLRGQQNPGY